jgi:hypothetical protein
MTDQEIAEYQRKIVAYFNSEKFERQWREFDARQKREPNMTDAEAGAIFGMEPSLFRLFYDRYLEIVLTNTEPPTSAAN